MVETILESESRTEADRRSGGERRPGIVHRLDKDTTGLLVVAKDLTSHAHLVDQLQKRKVSLHF